MEKVARAKSLYFKDDEAMRRFILLYKDLFVPYSEGTISYEAYVADYKVGKGLVSRGHIDEDVARMMRQGFVIYKGNDVVNLRILIGVNDFKNLLWMFKKERVRRGHNRYVYIL